MIHYSILINYFVYNISENEQQFLCENIKPILTKQQ